jgi:hypothetical protein
MRLLANPSSLDDGGERAHTRLGGQVGKIVFLLSRRANIARPHLHSATALDENCSDCRNLAVNSWNVLGQKSTRSRLLPAQLRSLVTCYGLLEKEVMLLAFAFGVGQ